MVAISNRIAPYLIELPPLPATAEARTALLSDAVFAAVLALQAQLTHHDPAVVRKAAGMILDFEKTRLRHGRDVAGTTAPPPTDSVAGVCDPGPAMRRPAIEDPEPDDEMEVGPTADEMEAAEAAGGEPDGDDELAEIYVPPIVPAGDRAAYREYVQDVREVLTVGYKEIGCERAVDLSHASQVAHLAVSMRFAGQGDERKRRTAGVTMDE